MCQYSTWQLEIIQSVSKRCSGRLNFSLHLIKKIRGEVVKNYGRKIYMKKIYLKNFNFKNSGIKLTWFHVLFYPSIRFASNSS